MAVIGDQNSLEPILVKHRRRPIRRQRLFDENAQFQHSGPLPRQVLRAVRGGEDG
jgi:hypothetical protein